MIITIDGPVASGKSTVARLLAEQLNYYYVCSGFLYRSLAYILSHHYGYTELTICNPAIEDIDKCIDEGRFMYKYTPQNKEHVFFDGVDITPYLKSSTIDKLTSIVSVNRYARECVTRLQYLLAKQNSIVIDGRDVGSVVFPNAQVKFFLTASVEVRAQRWLNDQLKAGNNFSMQQAIACITDRDERDKNRSVAPLKIPLGAKVVDSSLLTIDQTVTTMMAHVNDSIGMSL